MRALDLQRESIPGPFSMTSVDAFLSKSSNDLFLVSAAIVLIIIALAWGLRE